MTDVSAPPAGAAPDDRPSDAAPTPHLGWAVAGLSAAAGGIHLAMVPSHAGGELIDPIGFAVVGWAQILLAGAILAGRARRGVYQAAVVGNLAVLGLWLWSRTAGLPVGSHSGTAEDVTIVDATAAALEVGVVLLAVRILLQRGDRPVAVGRLAPAVLGVAALGLASVVIVSDDAADHGGGGHSHGEEAAGHGHEEGDAHASLMARIDSERCDLDFNHQSYWDEAAYLGIDTYQGGNMSASDHDHADTTTATTDPDPTSGRGSAALDSLITYTEKADEGEIAAGHLVSELSKADDDTYAQWLWWLRATGTVGGSHDHDAAAPDDSGHGGHAGPQPWVAMTDPEECAALEEELEIAREVALRYPTAADAAAAGWRKVTPYVQGIAAHYMNFSLVDGEFAVDEPEMILYDGHGDDARVVGLSYYVVHEGDSEPTQGFTGANDHYHRHVGLCQGPGGVIGDSTTTEEECEAMGGRKANGSQGWMSHAWVVPGCESPWGVFSAASPVLDTALAGASGTNDGGCAGSGVRERYGLDDPEGQSVASGAQPARAGGG